ncbi:MAG: xanthine dehydrogenase family protein molybdopterin-binding subunit [Betaproteobacteria bacterium]|nr:xanthine dehydrogenase family protein molybdopterin-binding subunit [Betaproteobacteria bacterium]
MSNAARLEDRRLITGHGRFTADWQLPGQLHAAVVRSDRAHAVIERLDCAAAAKVAGVVAVLTQADIEAAGINPMPGGLSFTGKNGQAMKKPAWPVLAKSHVHFVGQAIAVVIAESASVALDAALLVQIDYRELPAVISFEDALHGGAAQLHAEVPGNLAFEYEDGDERAVANAFATAKYVSRVTAICQRLVGNPMEPRACAAAYDGATDIYTVYTPTQGINGIRNALAQIVNVAKEKVRIVAEDVGGSFGIRSPAYPEHIVCIHAAKRFSRPVKWVGSRTESFVSDNHGRALSLTVELAMNADERFLAIRFDNAADIGAYATSFGAWIGTRNLTVTMGGVYRIPAMYAQSRIAYTNATPVSVYRGAGRPDIAFAIERLVDHAAAEHGFDPVALRRKNFIPCAAMPYKTSNGTTYGCGDFAAVLDDALARADWSSFASRRSRSKGAGKLRGIGIATYLEASGGGAAPKDQVEARWDKTGNVTVYTLAHSSGQGHETTFARIVAGALGMPIERVHVREGDPDVTLVGSGTGGSRSLLGAGSACKVLAENIVGVARTYAARLLEVTESELRYASGRFETHDRSLSIADLAVRLAALTPHPFNLIGEGSFGVTFPNGCHVAEVEIDPQTGRVAVLRHTVVDDSGNVISPNLVEGQIQGGVVQGAGQVLGEQAIYDRHSGQFLSASFMDYPMPKAGIVRSFQLFEHPVPTATNALGAKGVGEAGTSGSIPAMTNAVLDALRPLGVKNIELPATPAVIWNAMARAAQAARVLEQPV